MICIRRVAARHSGQAAAAGDYRRLKRAGRACLANAGNSGKNPKPSGRQPSQSYDLRVEVNPLPLCIAQPSSGGPNGERKRPARNAPENRVET
jgi:hypothetical protein